MIDNRQLLLNGNDLLETFSESIALIKNNHYKQQFNGDGSMKNILKATRRWTTTNNHSIAIFCYKTFWKQFFDDREPTTDNHLNNGDGFFKHS